MTDVASNEQAPQAPALTGPWADDVAATFSDPEVAAAVSTFLGEKVQPYVTRKEQEVTELASARELYDDLIADPGNTWLALTSEIFGEDRAEQILTAYHTAISDGATPEQAQQEAQQVAEQTEETNEQTPPVAALSEDDRAALDEYKLAKAREQYNQAVDAFIAEKEDDKLVKDLFHTFIAAADGDLDQAYDSYTKARETFAPGEQQEPTPPPNVLGSDAQSAQSSETPVLPPKQSLGAAIDDIFADTAPPAPPTVGGV